MILVTVGTQLPFPRLIHHLDRLAPGLGRPILAQIGADPAQPGVDVTADVHDFQNHDELSFLRVVLIVLSTSMSMLNTAFWH